MGSQSKPVHTSAHTHTWQTGALTLRHPGTHTHSQAYTSCTCPHVVLHSQAYTPHALPWRHGRTLEALLAHETPLRCRSNTH